MRSKRIGSVFIVIGTSLGAGMLALPMVSLPTNFFASVVTLIVLWALMIYTAFLILEVNLAFDIRKNNFATMARRTFGKTGKIITWIGFLLLLYALCSAYISGNASLLSTLIESNFHVSLPSWLYAVLFTIVFGGFVFVSTRAVDMFNRGLLSVKGALLIFSLIFLIPHLDVSKIIAEKRSISYLWAGIPIFLCSFGFHHIIPSLTNYVGKSAKELKKIIIIGITIPLVFYIIWIFCTFCIVPLYGKESLTSVQDGSVGQFIQIIIAITQSKPVSFFINGFSNIAMTTSFLGVALGLFDFLADALSRTDCYRGRFQTILITLIPPLFFAIFFPDGFLLALGYAGVFVAILLIILPALMVYKLRKDKKHPSPYRAFGNNFMLFFVMFIGLVVIAIQILANLKLLPAFFSNV